MMNDFHIDQSLVSKHRIVLFHMILAAWAEPSEPPMKLKS